MALRVLTGERSAELDAGGAWPAAAELLGAQVGGVLAGSGDALLRDALRQMVLTEIAVAADGLPKALASAWGPVNAEQRRRTNDLLIAWRADPVHRDAYGDLARQVDDELGLVDALPWAQGLAGCVATPAIEDVAFAEAVRRLGAGETTGAGTLAEQRLRISPWVQPQGPSGEGWATTARQWRAVQATAELLSTVSENPPPKGCSPGQLLELVRRGGVEGRPCSPAVRGRSQRPSDPRRARTGIHRRPRRARAVARRHAACLHHRHREQRL